MDLNTKIIEAVRQQPDLYGYDSTLQERCVAWAKLAVKLNMKEQYLKIRWHSLVQRYQNDPNFKYASKMDFLQRNTEQSAPGGDWPEFIITEEDVKDREDDTEEYVFMELDEVEINTKPSKIDKPRPQKEIQKPKPPTETQIKNVKTLMTPTVRQDKVKAPAASMIIQSVGTLNRNSLPNNKLKDNKEMPTVKTIQIASARSTIQIDATNLEQPAEPPVPIELKASDNKKPKIFVIGKDVLRRNDPKMDEPIISEEPEREEPKKEEAKKEEPKRQEPKKDDSPPKSRDEDDIFGELVSAMIKRMDDTKKKNVKKEIMNLLLT